MDSVITFAAKDLLLVSVLGAIYLLYRLAPAKRKEFIILLVAAGLLSLVLSRVGHHLYDDPRPFIANPHIHPVFNSSTDNGFPSDHTLLASFLGFAALYYSRRVGVALLVVAVLVAWGRVAGHVHHLKDVAGSFLISAVATWVVIKLLEMKKRPREGGAASSQR